MLLLTASVDEISEETLRVRELIPDAIESTSDALAVFLEKYYDHVHSGSNTGALIDGIPTQRDSDLCSDEDLEKLRQEMLSSLSSDTSLDVRTVLKNVSSLYREKGTENAVKAFFKLVYDDFSASVYYPWDDVVIASYGHWNGEDVGFALDDAGSQLALLCTGKGNFTDNKSFISDTQRLQDSDYWQKYSYDIRATIGKNQWNSSFQKLLHPAGYKIFGSIFYVLFAELLNEAGMSYTQLYGRLESAGNIIYLRYLVDVAIEASYLIVSLIWIYQNRTAIRSTEWADHLWSRDPTPISSFSDQTVSSLVDDININVGTILFEGSSPPLWERVP